MNAPTRLDNDFEQLSAILERIRRDTATGNREVDIVATAERIYRARRRRSALFGADAAELFGEPAWDILLDLFVARHRSRTITVSSACIASYVPSTTALRYIDRLLALDLIEREDDPVDRRRRLVRLTDRGEGTVAAVLAAW